jgi:hypothetical protein
METTKKKKIRFLVSQLPSTLFLSWPGLKVYMYTESHRQFWEITLIGVKTDWHRHPRVFSVQLKVQHVLKSCFQKIFRVIETKQRKQKKNVHGLVFKVKTTQNLLCRHRDVHHPWSKIWANEAIIHVIVINNLTKQFILVVRARYLALTVFIWSEERNNFPMILNGSWSNDYTWHTSSSLRIAS